MAKTKISEWSATPASNTDIDGINIAEGCAPSGINDAIREMMSQVKDLYSGTTGDAIAIAGGGTSATTASAARTALGVAIGTDVLPVANPSYTGTLTGGTGVVNFGSGQFYKDASGNVGIGTSSPAYKVDITGTARASGAFIPSTSSWTNAAFRAQGSFGGAISFIDSTAGYAIYVQDSGARFTIANGTTSGGVTERVNINSVGTVLIGTNVTGLSNSNFGWQLARDNESFAITNTPASILTLNRNNDGDVFKFFRNGTQQGWIGIATTGTTYGTLSDRRAKKNIAPASSALNKVAQVSVESFDWVSGGHTDYGFVAQDLHAVFPFAVAVGDAGEEIEKPWGLDNSSLVPVLFKAIQEQQAIITALTARVASLEASNTPICVALTPEATEPVVMTVEVKP